MTSRRTFIGGLVAAFAAYNAQFAIALPNKELGLTLIPGEADAMGKMVAHAQLKLGLPQYPMRQHTFWYEAPFFLKVGENPLNSIQFQEATRAVVNVAKKHELRWGAASIEIRPHHHGPDYRRWSIHIKGGM